MQLKKIAHKVDVNSKKYDIELYHNESYINKLSNITSKIKERSIFGKINFLHDTIWININKYTIGTIKRRKMTMLRNNDK